MPNNTCVDSYRLASCQVILRAEALRHESAQGISANIAYMLTWDRLAVEVERRFGAEISEELLLFLVGLNRMGRFPEGEEKLVKLELIQLGTLVILERAGYMREIGVDAEGWPQWQRLRPLPSWTPGEQRAFLREGLIRYFAEIWEL
ncbi:MAG: hypothetical protein NZZ60_00195 [Bacteroidia bacterium]|nr:hypothetical protein [Bacteroidia bacterium]MCX7651771.1 hypothetical protein [Bacteroidia bacterium]MDW8416357.1 hypothetical protein [Bacteroidia bacterium]